jgi:hypothetical protein
MSKFQLILRDEYGQVSIVATSENVEDLIQRGKDLVTNDNVNNVLTASDRERSWESFIVIIESDDDEAKYYYGGPIIGSNKIVYKVTPENVSILELKDVPNPKIRFYLGDISAKRGEEVPWFARDIRGNDITSLDHQDLREKMLYYVKRI